MFVQYLCLHAPFTPILLYSRITREQQRKRENVKVTKNCQVETHVANLILYSMKEIPFSRFLSETSCR